MKNKPHTAYVIALLLLSGVLLAITACAMPVYSGVAQDRTPTENPDIQKTSPQESPNPESIFLYEDEGARVDLEKDGEGYFLRVSGKGYPEEHFRLNVPVDIVISDLVKTISFDEDWLSVTYDQALGQPDERFELGCSLPAWIKAYYGLELDSGILRLIDFNFDGIPELCQYTLSTGGNVFSNAYTFLNGKAVPFELYFQDWIWLVDDGGTPRWLFGDWVPKTDVCRFSLIDYADILAPVETELLYVSLFDWDNMTLPRTDENGETLYNPIKRVSGISIELTQSEKNGLVNLWINEEKEGEDFTRMRKELLADFGAELPYRDTYVELNPDAPDGESLFYTRLNFISSAAKMLDWCE